ncbi:MAG: class II aldolase/adducin family protein [Maricaulaceae bacterium]|jgi:ribulose-5-phosphate 4-epimerase/fuculose-1-phosphate aldolase
MNKPVIGAVKSQVSEEEWELRKQLAAAYRYFAHVGWDDLIFTHLSVRVPGPEHHFLLNPYELAWDEITASNLIKVGTDGELVMATPYTANPAGFTIHSALHMAREDAHCVMHLHTVPGQAVSAQEDGLQPWCQTAMVGMAGGVAYHDYEGIATDLDERERLVADMGEKNVMILRNHGTLTVGETIADAFIRMYFLERGCQVQVQALAGGVKLNTPPQGTPEKVSQQGEMLPVVAQGLAWPAVYRKMARLYPELET